MRAGSLRDLSDLFSHLLTRSPWRNLALGYFAMNADSVPGFAWIVWWVGIHPLSPSTLCISKFLLHLGAPTYTKKMAIIYGVENRFVVGVAIESCIPFCKT